MYLAAMAAENLLKPHHRYERFFAGAMCALPVISIVMPRALTVLPILVALAAFFFYHRDKGRWPVFDLRIFTAMGALLTLMGASALWSVDSGETIGRTLKTAPLLLGGALLFNLARAESGEYFSRWFPAAFAVSCLLMLIEFYAGAPFYHLVHEQAAGAAALNLFYLNRTAALFIMLMPLAATCVYKSTLKPAFRYAFYIFFLFSAAAVLLKTDSQSAQLAFAAGLAFYILFPVRTKHAWTVLAAVLALILITAPWIAEELFKLTPAYMEESGLATRGSVGVRLSVWNFIAERALERPFSGYGIEATKIITDFSNDPRSPYQALHPHNFALQLWIEMGISGALFAAAFLGWVLKGMRKMEPAYARAALATMVTVLSVAAMGYGLWQGMWLGAFAMLASFCVLAADKKPAG